MVGVLVDNQIRRSRSEEKYSCKNGGKAESALEQGIVMHTVSATGRVSIAARAHQKVKLERLRPVTVSARCIYEYVGRVAHHQDPPFGQSTR